MATKATAPWAPAASAAPAPQTSTPAAAIDPAATTPAPSTENAAVDPVVAPIVPPVAEPVVEPTVVTPVEVAPAASAEVYVTVTVPKFFQLRVEDGTVYPYKAGVQEMRLEHADHWYARANGVTIYKPSAQ